VTPQILGGGKRGDRGECGECGKKKGIGKTLGGVATGLFRVLKKLVRTQET